MNLHFATPRRHPRTGKIGAHAIVTDDSHGWTAQYDLHTHALKPAEVAAKVTEVRERHRKWAGCIDRFADVRESEIVISQVTYRIVDCTIPSGRPFDHGFIIIGVREVDGENLRRVSGFPLRLPFPSFDAVPANEAIIAEVRARLEELHARLDVHETYTETVRRLISK